MDRTTSALTVNPKRLSANPISMGMGLILATGTAGILWLITRKKKTPPSAPIPPPSYVTTSCVINENVLDAWGKAMGIGILVSDPSTGTAVPRGTLTLPLLAWNPGETFLRGLNDISAPDALATKSYCEWAAQAPGTPPTEIPQTPAQQPTVQGPESVYVVKRLFVWTGTSWVLEDQSSSTIAAGQPDWMYQSEFSWPMFNQLQFKPPPYYYADGWVWSGTWKRATCTGNYKIPGCE